MDGRDCPTRTVHLPHFILLRRTSKKRNQAVAVMFIAQIYNIPLDLSAQLTVVLTATLASIGTAGVPSAGIIMLIVVLQSVGLGDKVEAGIALILGVDRILDMLRTSVNVTGDLSCSAFIERSEGEKLEPAGA